MALIYPAVRFDIQTDHQLLLSIDPALILAEIEQATFTPENQMVFVIDPWLVFEPAGNILESDGQTLTSDGEGLEW